MRKIFLLSISIFTTMRKLALFLTIGLFLSATAANACDGDKAVKHTKGTKTMNCGTDAKCMKNGKCTMTKAEMKKSGCCDAKATGSKASAKSMSAKTAKAGCDMKSSASGTHSCCHSKTTNAEKS